MVREFTQICADVNTVDWKGNPIKIANAPALQDKKTGRIWYEPQAIARAEFRQFADSLGLIPRQIPLLLMFYAQPGSFQRGYLNNKYKLNKMLFYQWKELEKVGLGEAFEHDEFVKDKKGPVPKNLYDDLRTLADRGLINVSGGPKEHKTLTADMTKDGHHIAENIWKYVPPQYKEITTTVKSWLFPLNPNTIKDRVHEDYPEFRKIYKELDEE